MRNYPVLENWKEIYASNEKYSTKEVFLRENHGNL